MRLWHWFTYPFRRQKHRPLAYRQPRRGEDTAVPLGLEAIDMSLVNAANKRNASLERVNTFFGRDRRYGSFAENADMHVTPFSDDENYAAHYHRAYNQKKGHDR
ncbi:MAG: hypothetical protein AAF999_09270 [Pseudomonadota bacterium]